MIYNYTKCESVIAKIMADLDSTEVRLRTSDIREWIFEAVDKIGAPMLYIKRESGADGVPILEIEDYQVPIPEELQHLDGVAYSPNPKGPWTPMKTKTGVFKEPLRPLEPPYDPHQPMMYKMPTTQYELHIDQFSHKAHDGRPKEDPLYFIKPGWIVTNRRHGFIKLAYKAVATDERGYPLVPDLTSYLEAIYWYVTMKLAFPKLMKGRLGGRGVNTGPNLYTYIQQQWNFYRNQAYAEAMMPTPDDMLSIKNEWNKLIPDVDANDTFFNDINKEQLIYNDYYHGY